MKKLGIILNEALLAEGYQAMAEQNTETIQQALAAQMIALENFSQLRFSDKLKNAIRCVAPADRLTPTDKPS